MQAGDISPTPLMIIAMNEQTILTVLSVLETFLRDKQLPIVSELSRTKQDPFKILISTILSLRTKDAVTAAATERLFRLASTPRSMQALSEESIRKAIYPVGFYRRKAQTIRDISAALIERYNGQVPADIDELLTLKGVGRKTANLVVTLGYDGDGICVDTHVHRISNRLGYVRTSTPHETERVLRERLPRACWRSYNTIMVSFGQTVCRPVSPLCTSCPVSTWCEKVGVTRFR